MPGWPAVPRLLKPSPAQPPPPARRCRPSPRVIGTSRSQGWAGPNAPKLNWEEVETHRRWVQTSRGEMALKADKGMKIDVREGYGEFVDAHTLKITPVEGEPYTVSFGAAGIATGAPAFVPPIPGARANLT